MHPLLHPSLTFVWRDPATLQIGTAPELVIGGLGPVETALLRAMDGHTSIPTLRELATAAGADDALADRMIDLLSSVGAVVDADQLGETGPAGVVTPGTEAAHQVRAPDQASLGLIHRGYDGGRAAFARRRQRRVDVVGAGRVGASVARLLASGGIGDVNVDDDALVAPADVSPAGHATDAIGLARSRSLRATLWSAPDVPEPLRAAPDLVVLAPTDGAGSAQHTTDLIQTGIPHLLVRVVEVTGVVGPLVVPGTTACLHCLDLHRTDRDPRWPAVLDQLARRSPSVPACDTSLATAVAGLAAGQVLAYLDGYNVTSLGGTLEIQLPYGLPRRRSWQPHPDCPCCHRLAAE